MITKISAYIMPLVILIIVGYGMYKKSDNYDNFVNGAEDGMRTVVSIAPTLIGLMVAVGVLRASGFLDFIAGLLSGVCGKIGIPASIVPLIIVRLFSSSAATGLSCSAFYCCMFCVNSDGYISWDDNAYNTDCGCGIRGFWI